MVRVVFTGGSGKAGRYVIPELLKAGHEVLNLDLETSNSTILPSEVHTLKVDLTQAGQVFNALYGQFRPSAPFPAEKPPVPDAVIHFAGMPRNLICTDDETFRINALATYNVIDAACKIGVKKIIVASTACVYGPTFASGDIDFESFPVDEDADVNPMDTYAISKVCCETIARGFARRFKNDIYCYRMSNVLAPEEYTDKSGFFESYVNEPEKWKVHVWSYTDARDLGGMCNKGLEVSGLGFQIFNATNDGISNERKTTELLKECCPNVPITRELGEHEAPMSNAKMKRLLGFEEEHPWQKSVTGR